MEINKELLKAIKQAQEGKEEGFNKIYSSTYNFVYFRAKTIMKTDDEAWDLLQEVYIVAYKSISKLERPENLYAWLGGIAYNLGMKAYRKKKEVLLDEENVGFFEDVRSMDKDIQPEEYVEDKQTCNIVKELIDQLPELQKVAVIAYYFDEMSVGEIAEKFECSTGTIKSRLNYARQYLKQAVENKEKKDNIKLHSISIPTIFIALRMLSEENAVSAKTAQITYNGVCANLGLGATSIDIDPDIDTDLGNNIFSDLQTAEATTKVSGFISKFAAATTGIKAIIISTIAVVSISSVIGGISLVNKLNQLSQNEKVQDTVTQTNENNNNVDNPSQEDLALIFAVSDGLCQYMKIPYNKGDTISDEDKMLIAYGVLHNLIIAQNKSFGFEAVKKTFSITDNNGQISSCTGSAYIIPQDDMDDLLKLIFGGSVSEHKSFDYIEYKDNNYYFFDGWDIYLDKLHKDESSHFSSSTESNYMIETGKYTSADNKATGNYQIKFEKATETKFGSYSLVKFEGDNLKESNLSDITVPQTIKVEEQQSNQNNESIANESSETKNNQSSGPVANQSSDITSSTNNSYDIIKDFLTNYNTELNNPEINYSEYFIYDWNKNKVPILIIRDVINKGENTCIYTDYHYIESKNILEDYGQSIHGSWNSSFYKKEDSFIMVTDEISDDSESHGAYLYGDLRGADTKTDELWFWFRNNNSQTTQFLDIENYKETRAEVEKLEEIKWFSIDDLSPFK